MQSPIRKTCLFAIAFATAAALGQDAPPAKSGLLKPDDVHATMVTLHAHKSKMQDVLDQLNQQSGMHITQNGFTNDTVTLDADAKPFWEVLSAVCDQTHMGVPFSYGYDFSTAIPLMQGMDNSQSRRIVSGPVLAIFNSLGRVDQMTAAPAIRDFCDINVNLIWEPRLAVAYAESFSNPAVAVDENGLSLVPSNELVDPRNPWAEKYQSPGGNGRFTFFAAHSIRLKIPPQAGRRLAHLSGQIRLWVVENTKPFEVTNLKPGAKNKSMSAQNLNVQNIWSNNDSVQVQLSASRFKVESPEAWQQRRCRLSAMHGKILDADGNTWAESSGQMYGQMRGDDSFNSYLQFQRPNNVKTAPKKIVIDVPVSAVEIDVPYELKDLPLP